MQVEQAGVVRRIDVSSAVVSTLAGAAGITGRTDATGVAALFNRLMDITIDPAGVFLLVVGR